MPVLAREKRRILPTRTCQVHFSCNILIERFLPVRSGMVLILTVDKTQIHAREQMHLVHFYRGEGAQWATW